MTATSTTYIYEGWRASQEMLVRALSPLSAEQMALAAAPRLWSIGALTAHIVLVRAGWMHFTLGIDDPRLAEFAHWQEESPPAPADLLRGLETTWAVMADTILRDTPEQMAETVEDDDGRGGVTLITRGWVVWHLLEHDLLHTGEIGLTLGVHALPFSDV